MTINDRLKAAEKEIAFLKKMLQEQQRINIITNGINYPEYKDFLMYDKVVIRMFKEEAEGDRLEGSKISGHKASLYLFTGTEGEWFNEKGENVAGYLFYKPNN